MMQMYVQMECEESIYFKFTRKSVWNVRVDACLGGCTGGACRVVLMLVWRCLCPLYAKHNVWSEIKINVHAHSENKAEKHHNNICNNKMFHVRKNKHEIPFKLWKVQALLFSAQCEFSHTVNNSWTSSLMFIWRDEKESHNVEIQMKPPKCKISQTNHNSYVIFHLEFKFTFLLFGTL